MYDELVKILRLCTSDKRGYGCANECAYGEKHPLNWWCMDYLFKEAADAIQELDMKLHNDEAAIAGMKREIERMVVTGKPRWIPVTERLPDMHVEVFVCTEDYGKTALGFSTCAVWDGTGWLETWERKTYLTAVTHWMPLPEPPKET